MEVKQSLDSLVSDLRKRAFESIKQGSLSSPFIKKQRLIKMVDQPLNDLDENDSSSYCSKDDQNGPSFLAPNSDLEEGEIPPFQLKNIKVGRILANPTTYTGLNNIIHLFPLAPKLYNFKTNKATDKFNFDFGYKCPLHDIRSTRLFPEFKYDPMNLKFCHSLNPFVRLCPSTFELTPCEDFACRDNHLNHEKWRPEIGLLRDLSAFNIYFPNGNYLKLFEQAKKQFTGKSIFSKDLWASQKEQHRFVSQTLTMLCDLLDNSSFTSRSVSYLVNYLSWNPRDGIAWLEYLQSVT